MASQPSGNADVGKTCPRCRDLATEVCGVCKNISYCSSECQQADWPVHKLLCKTFRDFTNRPSDEMRRIVVFLPDEKSPRFMWAPARCGESDENSSGEVLAPYEDVDPSHVTDAKAFFYARDTNKNAWNGLPLGYAIQVRFDECGLFNYQERNQAVVAATQGMDSTDWRGPIFAYCGTLRGGNYDSLDIVKIHDMDMRAYSYLVAYLIDHFNETLPQLRRKGQKVKCVKVVDNAGQEGLEAFQEVRVPPSHPIFEGHGALSHVSEQVQEPLITWHSTERGIKAVCGLSNPHVLSVHVLPDDLEDDKVGDGIQGFVGPHKLHLLDCGTHLIARTSGRPLECETVKAMVDFCRFHLPPYYQRFCELARDEDFRAKSPRLVELFRIVRREQTSQKWHNYVVQWKLERADKIDKESRGEHVFTMEKSRSGLERMGLTADDSMRLMDVLSQLDADDFELEQQLISPNLDKGGEQSFQQIGSQPQWRCLAM